MAFYCTDFASFFDKFTPRPCASERWSIPSAAAEPETHAVRLSRETFYEASLVNFRPSLVAAAVLVLSRKAVGSSPFWPQALVKLTGTHSLLFCAAFHQALSIPSNKRTPVCISRLFCLVLSPSANPAVTNPDDLVRLWPLPQCMKCKHREGIFRDSSPHILPSNVYIPWPTLPPRLPQLTA